MKYLILLFALLASSHAYAQCSEFETLLKKGDKHLRGDRPNYKEAINAYTAAILACSERAEEARQRISRMVTKINRLKEEAVTAKNTADTLLINLRKALTEIEKRNVSVFESFAGLGKDLIRSLNHVEALEKMKVALEIDVNPELKKRELTAPLEELLYFFAEGNRRPELARDAAELLVKLNPTSSQLQTLQQCLREKWSERSQFAPLLHQLSSFQKLNARYYPTMITVPTGANGTFEMGSPESEQGHQSDETPHYVQLSSYKIAETPVTFYQFALFCESRDRGVASRRPYWGQFGDHPAVSVNWYEAAEYADWLNGQNGLAAVYDILKENYSDENNNVSNDFLKWRVDLKTKDCKGYRLPTEAEWELAARGGTGAPRTLYAGSDILDSVGWYWQNSGDKRLEGDWDLNRIYDNNGRTWPVKSKKANFIDVYDMSGNVWEWCWDWYDSGYYEECNDQGTVQNPQGPEGSSVGRVLRGGSWGSDPESCRVAYRDRDNPGHRRNFVGFRLVLVP
jgi:formylglycine-generating enzyme required for sulfatase activity